MAPITVGVLGARGRMGREVCNAIDAAPELTLVGGVSSGDSRDVLGPATVLVDFTRPDSVMGNIRWGVTHGMNVVVGTSGVGEGELATISEWLSRAPTVGVIVVPNFCISAVLAMRFAALAAPHFESAEIIDLAHRAKKDAPSGTAVRTAQMIEAARGVPVGTTKVHSIRLDGLMSHQAVMLSRPGEILTIRFDTPDRAAYMSGVLLAVREIAARPGLTVGLDPLLKLGP
jgi:4-hydroxy-tetrahydrodipicolinate reductase